MSTSLSGVISEFGGTGSIPNNMTPYRKMAAYTGWYGGVAEHDNNSAIPYSGNLALSNFASPADKDFVSDTYVAATSTYYDFNIPFYQTFVGYALNNAAINNSGLFYLTAVGTAGSRVNVGKSTFLPTGQTAQVSLIGDFNDDGTTGVIIGMSGDQRATGWGGAGGVGSGGVQAPYYIVLNGNTYYMSSSAVPNGQYLGGTDTYWVWFGAVSGLVDGNFTYRVGIY